MFYLPVYKFSASGDGINWKWSDCHGSKIMRAGPVFHHTWHFSYSLPVNNYATVILTWCSAWPFRKCRSDNAIIQGSKCLTFDPNQEAELILCFLSCERLIAPPRGFSVLLSVQCQPTPGVFAFQRLIQFSPSISHTDTQHIECVKCF